jgi:hypothetical protein
MAAQRSLGIAIGSFVTECADTAQQNGSGPDHRYPIDIRASFVIRRGIYRNFVRERSAMTTRRSTRRRPARATEARRW